MEQSFVAWAKMRAHRLPKPHLGIGDDAALLADREDGEYSVVTADSLMDGVHFQLEKMDPRDIGRKLVNVNLSDLAAMGAKPEALFLSLCLPLESEMPTDLLASEIYEGVCEAAEENQVSLAGGDTNCWAGSLVLHLTAIGKTENQVAWLRSTVQPDDLIVVTGALGGSIRGKHLSFKPRLDLVGALKESQAVNAAMDISDGLSVDFSGCATRQNVARFWNSNRFLLVPMRNSLQRRLASLQLITRGAMEKISSCCLPFHQRNSKI